MRAHPKLQTQACGCSLSSCMEPSRAPEKTSTGHCTVSSYAQTCNTTLLTCNGIHVACPNRKRYSTLQEEVLGGKGIIALTLAIVFSSFYSWPALRPAPESRQWPAPVRSWGCWMARSGMTHLGRTACWKMASQGHLLCPMSLPVHQAAQGDHEPCSRQARYNPECTSGLGMSCDVWVRQERMRRAWVF